MKLIKFSLIFLALQGYCSIPLQAAEQPLTQKTTSLLDMPDDMILEIIKKNINRNAPTAKDALKDVMPLFMVNQRLRTFKQRLWNAENIDELLKLITEKQLALYKDNANITRQQEIQDGDTLNALHLAVEKNDIAFLKSVLPYVQKYFPDMINEEKIEAGYYGRQRNKTPLHLTFNPTVIELLLKYGANANITDSYGETQLYWILREWSSRNDNAFDQAIHLLLPKVSCDTIRDLYHEEFKQYSHTRELLKKNRPDCNLQWRVKKNSQSN